MAGGGSPLSLGMVRAKLPSHADTPLAQLVWTRPAPGPGMLAGPQTCFLGQGSIQTSARAALGMLRPLPHPVTTSLPVRKVKPPGGRGSPLPLTAVAVTNPDCDSERGTLSYLPEHCSQRDRQSQREEGQECPRGPTGRRCPGLLPQTQGTGEA